MIVALAFTKVLLYIVMTVIVTILKELFQRLLGRNIHYPTPNFNNIFSSPVEGAQRERNGNGTICK